MTRENIVITGVGVVSAIGIGASEFFEGLLQGKSGVRSLGERTDGDAAPGPEDPIDGLWVGAPIVDFDPKQYVRPRKALKVMCREIQLSFASAQLAIENAGLSESLPAAEGGPLPPDRVGTVYGSEIFFSPPDEISDSVLRCVDESGEFQISRFGDAAQREIMPLWMLKYLPNMPACQIGISINAQGPNNTLVLGDVSGPAALLEAESYLSRGVADVMFAGATGTRITATRLNYRHDFAIPAVGEGPIESASRPHDPDAFGVVGGEGAATVIAETGKSASKRGARPLARLLSVCSRFAPTEAMQFGDRAVPPQGPHGRGATKAITLAIEAALQQAGVDPDQIGMVASHAVGDREVDSAERQAIQACGINAPVVAVSAALGHTGASLGMIEVAVGVLSISHGKVPPTIHEKPSTANLSREPRELDSDYVLCLSHTTEGSATATILAKP